MKFVSINIEGDKHFERILPFLIAKKPDVLALQEIFEADLDIIKQTTGLTNCVFYPQANITKPNIHLPVRGNWGLAIFAKEIVSHEAFYYFGHKDGIVATFENEKPDLIDRVVIVAKAKVADQIFQVATVHFTWSGKAETTEAQKVDYIVLQAFLDQFEEMIFCGDLNAMRGAEIWSALAKKYTDNIPAEVETTIDKNLHKSGKDIRLVVDALFTSSHYLVSDVQVVPNTSDHMAVMGEIERV